MSTNTRRNFIRLFSGAATSLPFLYAADPAFGQSAEKIKKAIDASPSSLNDEDFWAWIREAYTVSPNIINLNNGGVAPQPKVVQDAHIRYYQYANEAPSYYMWQILDQGREPLREKLALLCGCDKEEVAINRNSKAFTSRTKVVMVTHLINWTGQIMPVKKIADAAHARGIEVIADGAHTLAHFDFKIPDLCCDYYAASLHKWLSAPFGSGLLYIKKEKIKNVWALLSNNEPDGTDIRKFESLGTRSFASEMAIGAAVDFHDVMGNKRKEERLRFLKNYWVDQIKDLPKVSFNQPKSPALSCAIASVAIEGKKPEEISSELFGKHKIHTVAINWENIHGVRVTPNVYTSLKDLDKLASALKKMAI